MQWKADRETNEVHKMKESVKLIYSYTSRNTFVLHMYLNINKIEWETKILKLY